MKSKFYFAVENDGDIDAILADDRLAVHAKGVMDTISVSVAMLNDLSTLLPILKHLGASHAKFNLQQKHFQVKFSFNLSMDGVGAVEMVNV